MAIARYALGCPAWGLKSWSGRLFDPATPASDYLRCYAQVFNAVEGNTTFYALPKPETVARWCEDTPEDFTFCFKFPSVISHELGLAHAAKETATFLDRIAPLGPRLGPLMLQLPASFAPDHLPTLARYLEGLPSSCEVAVELRHRGFFRPGEAEKRVEGLFARRGVGWVTMDTRGLFAADRADKHVSATQRKKPQLPVRPRHTGQRPVVRFVPHPDWAHNVPLVEPWLRQLSAWIDGGKRPCFFMHAADDAEAPAMARAFHERMRATRSDVGELPPWPGERKTQLSLFS